MKRMVYLSPNEWKVLRAVVREGPVSGKFLRGFWYTRKTKDGKFLDGLVERGLLSVEGVRTKPAGRTIPQQFYTYYQLTELGEKAAEFGEYETEAPLPQKAK